MPTLEKHRQYIGLSFLCGLINGTVDCTSILNKLHFKLNFRSLRSIEFFNIDCHHTNYGRFNPLDALLMSYNSYSNILLDNNVKSCEFKLKFYSNIN